MTMKSVLILILVCSIGGPVAAAPKPRSPSTSHQDASLSSVDVTTDGEGHEVRTVTTTQFEFADRFVDEKTVGTLLKKVVREVRNTGVDGSTARLFVEARESKSGIYDHVVWTLNEEAHGAAYQDHEVFSTWLNGCCDAATAYRAYNVVTGKLIMTFDDRMGSTTTERALPYTIEVPNARPAITRFVGVLSASATRDFVSMTTPDGLQRLATISYANKMGLIQKFDLYGSVQVGWGINMDAEIIPGKDARKTEIREHHVTLWDSDQLGDAGAAVRGFALRISLLAKEKNEVIIPFESDRADIAHAVLPSGFRIEAARP